MRRAVPQQQREAPPPEDEGVLPHEVHLQATTPVDASLPGVTIKSAALLAWHPTRQRLLAATTVAAVEYDAVSGARRHLVEVTGTPLRLCYTPGGQAVIMLTKERGIYSWSTASWKRRVLLAPDPKYAGKKLAAGLLAVSGGQHPTVYWTPLGKNTVRMVQTVQMDLPKGAKLERDQVPGVKLKTENKKPIVGLAAHPAERGTIFVLLADGTLQVCAVTGASVAALHSLPIAGMNATAERVTLHAWPHPTLPGGVLLAVEATVSGVSILEAAPRQEPRLLGTLSFGPGTIICGVGLLASGLLCAAGRLASGNVQVQAWELAGDSRELQVLPTVAAPGMVWDALQSMVGKAALADVSGENMITRLHFHPPTGSVAVATALRGRETDAAHFRVPLLHLVDDNDPAWAPERCPIHTGLGFWTARDSDSTVSKLRFPRYAHVLSMGRLCSYDLTHGMLADYLVMPPTNAAGQERAMVHVVRSPKQSAWLAFTKVLSRKREGAPLGPGQREFSLVKDSEAALTTGQWTLPGADGAFVGGQDDLTVVLSNSGRYVSVYETAKLTGATAKPLYSAELKEGPMVAVYAGPPAHIPSPPTPPPPSMAERDAADSDDSDAGEDDEAIEARREWEAAERRRLDPPRLVLLRTQTNQLVLAEVSPSAVTYSNKSRVLPVRAALQLRAGEAVVQVAWQSLLPGDNSFHSGSEGASTVAAAAAAVLTSQRLLILNERLAVLASAGIPADMGLPVSCLWMGPALLVSTSTGQVLQVCWDGKLVHLCSLLNTSPPALLGALADRLLVAARPPATGRAEVSGRGLSVLQPLLQGWASLAVRQLVPGGMPRVRRELRALVSSYDASHLGATALERLAAAGFADVAAAVAASSDSPAITLAHKAVFQAAAGDWQPLLLMVMQEWEASTYHPGPPPRSSQLYAKMVALARTCQQYGRFVEARQLLRAAGAHSELLALCVFQGDFQGLQELARESGRDVERLADQLMAVNENAFVHGSTDGSLYSGRANVDDWRVSAGEAGNGAAAATAGAEEDGEAEGQLGEDEIEVAPAGRLPFQEASLQVLSVADPLPPAASSGDEGQPITGLDLGTLEAFIGVAGASVLKPAVSTPTAAAAGAAAAMMAGAASGGLTRMETGLSEISNPLEVTRRENSRGSHGYDTASDASGPAAAAAGRNTDETAAQAAARADFRRDTADDEDDFFSSDEDSAPTEADSRSVASLATASVGGSSRFKISIKSAEEASPHKAGDLGALRAAAQSLRLGAPSSLGGGSADSTPFGTSRSTSSAQVPSASGSAPKLGVLPPPPGISPAKPPAAATPAAGAAAAPAAGASAAAAASTSSDDPFADLFGGLTVPSGGGAALPAPGKPPQPPPPPAPAAPAGPMRPQAAPTAQSNLTLAGWDDFEALFAAAPAPQAQPAAAAGGAAAFGAAAALAAPPPPPSAPQPSAPQPSRVSPTKPAAPAALKKSGSTSELAPTGAKKAVDAGLEAFWGGKWGQAAESFGKAVDQGGGGGAFAAQALQLFVAARLLAAASGKSEETASRLARFAVALPALEKEPAQKAAAVAFAVEANMAAKNYGYAADQLTWLIIQSTSGLGGLDAQDLQDKLNTCDRAGGSNASLPRDEDYDSFAAIVGACSQRAEAEDLLANLMQS